MNVGGIIDSLKAKRQLNENHKRFIKLTERMSTRYLDDIIRWAKNRASAAGSKTGGENEAALADLILIGATTAVNLRAIHGGSR